MPQNLLLSFFFHLSVVLVAIVSLPFVAKKPIDSKDNKEQSIDDKSDNLNEEDIPF